MQIKIHAQHLSLSDEQKDFIEEKIGSLAHLADRLDDPSSEAKVDVLYESSRIPDEQYTCTLTLFVPRDTLRAEAHSDSFASSVDEVIEKIKGQIEHYKSKVHGGA